MSTSSIAAPDLRAICRDALRREVLASAPIGAGRNSRVFRVNLDGADAASPSQVVVKFYRRDAGDPRDRLGTEFGSLQFLWQNGIRAVPRPLAIDRDRRCAIYEYIDGEMATLGAVVEEDIDASVIFLAALKRLRDAPGSEALPAASEAYFSLADVVTSVERRRARLLGSPAGSDEGVWLRRWLAEAFDPLLAEVREWCRDAARRSEIAFAEPIAAAARTLSPSDFGFHNAIRRAGGGLAFVDFEYFGWDDPAKTIADYLLHPAMALGDALKRRFADQVQAAFGELPALAARARLVYPWFGLKWALILVNDFLPERFSQPDASGRLAQLAKAQAMTARVAREYADNPFLS